MGVQDAVNIVIADQFRKLAGQGEGDFIAAFAELRFDEWQTEGLVNILNRGCIKSGHWMSRSALDE